MAEIIMPKMGDAMTEGKVVRWYKKAGDAVKKGEPVLEIETDKVNLDLEAEQDGTLGDVAAEAGKMVEVGGVLATILGAGEKAQPKKEAAAPSRRRSAGAARHRQERLDQALDRRVRRGDRHESAARRSDRGGVERRRDAAAATTDAAARRRWRARWRASSASASSRCRAAGRADASSPATSRTSSRAAAAPQKAKAPSLPPMQQLETKEIPLTAMRRTIAKRLAESTGPIPHFYLTADYDVTNLLSLREQLNEIEGIKTSVNDFIVRAAALALRHHPNVNASWGDEAITQHGEIHIGIAVSTPEGLITPVVRNADQKSVTDISNEVRALADKAKNRKLTPNDYQGSTFTISNLGAWGIEQFTAIINPPNVAILAIGAASAQPVVIDRQVVIRDRMKVTMSCDHRVVDGALGAEYLRTLRSYIEQPVRLVL